MDQELSKRTVGSSERHLRTSRKGRTRDWMSKAMDHKGPTRLSVSLAGSWAALNSCSFDIEDLQLEGPRKYSKDAESGYICLTLSKRSTHPRPQSRHRSGTPHCLTNAHACELSHLRIPLPCGHEERRAESHPSHGCMCGTRMLRGRTASETLLLLVLLTCNWTHGETNTSARPVLTWITKLWWRVKTCRRYRPMSWSAKRYDAGVRTPWRVRGAQRAPHRWSKGPFLEEFRSGPQMS
jgi:hypothetical protein